MSKDIDQLRFELSISTNLLVDALVEVKRFERKVKDIENQLQDAKTGLAQAKEKQYQQRVLQLEISKALVDLEFSNLAKMKMPYTLGKIAET